MSKAMYEYTKSILERVSFDPLLFCKELEKAIKTLFLRNAVARVVTKFQLKDQS
jgi:hypothetical protein